MGKKNKKGNNSPNAVTLESSSPAHQMTGDSMRELEQAECNVPLISKDNPLIHEEPSAPPTPPTPPKVGELHPSGLEEADTGAPVSQFAPLQAPAPSRAVPVPSAPPQEGPEEDLPPPPILTVNPLYNTTPERPLERRPDLPPAVPVTRSAGSATFSGAHVPPPPLSIPALAPPSPPPRPLDAEAEATATPEATELVLEAPGNDEIADYAKYLGMRPQEDSELLWIAEQALCAPLPPGWKVYEDHVGRPYFFSTDTRKAQWEHPLDGDYRQLFRSMKRALREGTTYAEVTLMAHYLGIDAAAEPLLMWIARQAVLAPLPHGWEEKEDDKGVFYVDAETGEAQRYHPLDPVFKMLLAVERERLQKGQFSLTRAGGLGTADERAAIMRLVDDAGTAYYYDWVTRKKVEGPSAGNRRRSFDRAAGNPYLPEDSTLEPSPLQMQGGAPDQAGLSVSLALGGREGSAPSPSGGATPVGAARGPSVERSGGSGTHGAKSGSRLPVTLRTHTASTAKTQPSSALRQARDEMGGTVGGVKRGGVGLRTVAAGARASVARKYGLPTALDAPIRLTGWMLAQIWALALLIPLVRKVAAARGAAGGGGSGGGGGGAVRGD